MPWVLKYCLSSSARFPDSGPPQLSETNFAPSFSAVLTAASRSLLGESASIRVMPQFGQTAETMSRSSEISPDQDDDGAGNGLGSPFWLSFWKQPLSVVQAGSPNCWR